LIQIRRSNGIFVAVENHLFLLSTNLLLKTRNYLAVF